jgi:hypothetical protein
MRSGERFFFQQANQFTELHDNQRYETNLSRASISEEID